MKLYVNGQLKDTLEATNKISTSSAPVVIGNFSNGYQRFNGVIDDVRIYNRAIDESEVEALYNENKSSTVTNRVKNLSFTVYPNPAANYIYIDNIGQHGYCTVEIFNSLNQKVYQSTINQQKAYVDLSEISGNGLYFVRLINENGNAVGVQKIIVL